MKRNFRLLMEIILLLAGINARLEKRRVPLVDQSIMVSNAIVSPKLEGQKIRSCREVNTGQLCQKFSPEG